MSVCCMFPHCMLDIRVAVCVFQMQQQELAQVRQREANLTALAAIGPRKKRKLLDSQSSSAAAEVTLRTIQMGSQLIKAPVMESPYTFGIFLNNLCHPHPTTVFVLSAISYIHLTLAL